ncbi:MAG: FAD/NAD(P)-binding protein [Williamsia herbipolensis]|nr:FAD/NAD(P)-binding protein [Williamsia herbipolensis]
MTQPPIDAALVFVGGGPRTTSLLERIAANVDEIVPPDVSLDIHVVDPHPPGGGRIWRTAQSALLWMNSTAADVTIFTDSSVECAGPIVAGPTLAQWLSGAGRAALPAAGLGHHVDRFGPADFVPREIQGCYLGWVFDRVLASLPERVRVVTHAARAVSLEDRNHEQLVTLDDGTTIVARTVVLAQGYFDRRPGPEEARTAAEARADGLLYHPPAYTADLDLSGIGPGERVLVRGMGLAFVDLMALLGEGRGGTFVERPDGTLEYRPSGREPVLHVGSRRGVPYHSKLGYAIADAVPTPPVYFTVHRLTELGGGPLDFRSVLRPLIVKELTAAHYRRLFAAHPDRVAVPWLDFERVLDEADVLGPEFAALVRRAVPAAADRFEIDRVDRPLAGLQCADGHELTAVIDRYLADDLVRRADPRFSADRAVFDALLGVYAVLAWAITTGRVSAVDRIGAIEGEFHGLFSFLASGPPPRRLAELRALMAAGIVRPGGPDWTVEIRDGAFVGRGSAIEEEVRGSVLIDAWVPKPDIRAATDPVIAGLLADGELAAEDLVAADGRSLGGGQLLADKDSRAVRADGTVHPHRFLLGPSVSGSAGSSGFARPHFNAPGFRQNDAVARIVLTELIAADSRPRTDSDLRRTA